MTRTALFIAPFALVLMVSAWFSWNVVDNRRGEMDAYARARTALEAGHYNEAISYFAAAGGYRDAAELRTQAQQQLAPVRAAWLDALSAIDREEFDVAVALLEPIIQTMPTFEQAATLLDQARVGQLRSLERQVEVALIHTDWLIADYLLQELIRLDPASAAYQTELAVLREHHAPIVFEKGGRLYLIGPSGDDERLLFDDFPVTRPMWSPDRRSITFLDAAPGGSPFVPLYLLDIRTGLVSLISDSAAALSLPAWDRESRRIAFTGGGTESDEALLLYDLQTADVHVVDATAGLSNVTSPSWSPDGTRLAFLAGPRLDEGISTTVLDVFQIDLQSGELENLTGGTLPFLVNVAWSPVADQLLAWEKQGGTVWFAGFETVISLIDPDNRSVVPLTSRLEVTGPPAWTPDGQGFGMVVNGERVVVRSLAGPDISTVESKWRLSDFLTWSPGGDVLLASPANPSDPSLVVAQQTSANSIEWIQFVFEHSVNQPGPQWSATGL